MGNTCKSQNCCSTETQKEFQANEAVTSPNSQGTQDPQNQRNSSIRQQNQEPKPSIDANLAKEQNQMIVKHIREASVSSQREKQDELQRVETLKTLVGKVQNLKLKVISSTNLKKGKVFIMNPLQAEESARKNIDGYIYIGCKKYLKPKREDPQQLAINDIIIPAKETNEKHRGRHFVIWYDISKSSYRVKDLGIGFGVFVRLSFPLILQDNHLINLGESFVVVNLVRDSMEIKPTNDQDTSILPKLRLKLFGGPSTGEIFYFTGKEQKIVLGRMANCDVHIDDSLLSKQQATIIQRENQWILTDGYNNKTSTNGTWLYLNEEIEITNGMILKTSQTLLLAQLVDPNASSGSHNAGNQEMAQN